MTDPMDTATIEAAAAYFPLLGRPRPTCPVLLARVREITEIAQAARQQGTEALHDAAHALNKAALLVSDCGRPDAARRLCWRHLDLYRAANRPLTFVQARYMLEPVVNLARLHVRNDSPQPALRILNAVYHATTRGTDASIDGGTLPLAHLTGTLQERNKLREWVWLQLLTEGLRAFVRSGQWTEAAALAEARRGIGAHLLEGRQVAILAARLNGDFGGARALLHASSVTEPWEHQVASCLEVMCTDTGGPTLRKATSAMLHTFRTSEPRAGYAVFRTRLGLTATILASAAGHPAASALLNQVTAQAISAGDGYAARELLNHRHPVAVAAQQRHALESLVLASGLGTGALPPALQAALKDAISIAAGALAASLRAHPRAGGTQAPR